MNCRDLTRNPGGCREVVCACCDGACDHRASSPPRHRHRRQPPRPRRLADGRRETGPIGGRVPLGRAEPAARRRPGGVRRARRTHRLRPAHRGRGRTPARRAPRGHRRRRCSTSSPTPSTPPPPSCSRSSRTRHGPTSSCATGQARAVLRDRLPRASSRCPRRSRPTTGSSRALAAAEAPVLYHCTTGKDRTGWATAVLFRLLGVPEDADPRGVPPHQHRAAPDGAAVDGPVRGRWW